MWHKCCCPLIIRYCSDYALSTLRTYWRLSRVLVRFWWRCSGWSFIVSFAARVLASRASVTLLFFSRHGLIFTSPDLAARYSLAAMCQDAATHARAPTRISNKTMRSWLTATDGSSWAGVVWNPSPGPGVTASKKFCRARLMEYFELIADTKDGGILV